MQTERPIFVIGSQRSGTTLLRYILCSHPKIYIPPESNFIPRFFQANPQDALKREQAIRILEGILQYHVFFRDWKVEKPDPAKFVDSLPDIKPATLLGSLYGQYAYQKNCERWGDKSPIYTGYVPLLAKIFPDAQFIHIVRDGRDVALSMLKAYQTGRFFYVDLCYAAQTWKKSVRNARISGSKLGPDRYLELKYEQMVAQPEATIQTICQFLNEEFVPAMLEPQKQAQELYHSKGIHAATREPLNTKSVGRWRVSMPKEDQHLFQLLAGDALAELGYETVDLGRLSALQAGRYFWLQFKFALVETGRWAVQSLGIFHPTRLLSRKNRAHPPSRTI